jgi:hypothetical protein
LSKRTNCKIVVANGPAAAEKEPQPQEAPFPPHKVASDGHRRFEMDINETI